MSVLLAASLPLLAVAGWVVWRVVRGRPVRRFGLNAVVGVMLLVYFSITAGLGIFWVANQELPVFDLHYLFGYLTATLVVTHVWINAPLIARFVRKRVPALAAEGQRFRPSVAWAARIGGVAAFGGLCFWIGWSRGVSVVTITPGAPVQAPSTALGAHPGASATGMPEVLVREHGRAIPLSRWYHDRSAHSRRRVVERGPRIDWNQRPDVFESYPSVRTIALPRTHAALAVSTSRALDGAADAVAAIGDAPVSLAQLGTLLHLTQGITEVDGPPGQPFYKRAAASSGALYPVVTHVVVGRVDGLAPGLYHYAPREHALHLLREGDVRGELAAVSAGGADLARAPFTVVFSAIYHRSSWKYGERGYRYALLDTGHALANAQAAGAAAGLASRAIGRFDDARVAKVLGVAPPEQGPIVLVPLGARADRAADGDDAAIEPRFAIVDAIPARASVPDSVRIVAARTGLALTSARGPPFAPVPALAPRAVAADAIVEPPPVVTPAPSADATEAGGSPADLRAALGPVIERRRSTRRFSDAPVELATLARVLDRARGGGIEHQRALRMHVIAIRVNGLAPGVYEHRADGSLARVRAGDVRDPTYELALSQEVVERAAAVVAVSADVAAFSWPDGSRGFRYAWIDAGVAAGRMYLEAVAVGLGISSVGAFFDDELVELLGVDGTRELPALLVTLGRE